MPTPEHRSFDSTDYSTGRRTVTHDIDIPDRGPDEPLSVRAQARESGTNTWTVGVTHGPFEQKDESGSYYRHISSDQFTGPIGKVRSHLKKTATSEWKGYRGARK